MNRPEIRAPLGWFLDKAVEGELDQGWVYLPVGPIDIATECLFLDWDDPEAKATYATTQGFPQEGLDTQDLAETVRCIRSLTPNPTDAQRFRSFEYYWRFDAWLPAMDAENPLENEAHSLVMDLDFLASLGPERTDATCRHADCERGAVAFSVLCARHHFERIRGRPCPAAD